LSRDIWQREKRDKLGNTPATPLKDAHPGGHFYDRLTSHRPVCHHFMGFPPKTGSRKSLKTSDDIDTVMVSKTRALVPTGLLTDLSRIDEFNDRASGLQILMLDTDAESVLLNTGPNMQCLKEST
jgi:hypothetical protein